MEPNSCKYMRSCQATQEQISMSDRNTALKHFSLCFLSLPLLGWNTTWAFQPPKNHATICLLARNEIYRFAVFGFTVYTYWGCQTMVWSFNSGDIFNVGAFVKVMNSQIKSSSIVWRDAKITSELVAPWKDGNKLPGPLSMWGGSQDNWPL
jgi:hypothetical protein